MMSDLQILFEDRHLISVVKPYSVLSQGNDSNHSIADDISDYLKAKGESADVYVVHRLDKTTSGVMVFAKTKECAARLSELISKGEFIKEYSAVLCGKVEQTEGELTDLLYHDKNKNKTYVVKRERKGVKKAKLSFKVQGYGVYSDSAVTMVDIKLHTGRTHQIRVQFSSRKHPLVGDRKYGSSVHSDTIALYSRKISFTHPFTKERICVQSEPIQGAFAVFL